MKVYEEKFMNGHNEDSTSAMKNAAVTRLKRQTPQFNVFQAQRRGISVKDVEKGPNYCYTAEKKEVATAEIKFTQQNEILSAIKSKKEQKANLLAQLAKSGKLDPIKINQNSDPEPVVRPDGQKPRVKSNILANQRNKGGSQDSTDKNANFFRHSKKVESVEFVFEPTTLRPVDLLTITTTTATTEAATTTTTPTVAETTTKNAESQESQQQIVSSTPPTSLLDVFLSTQVLNTRAVDPTLASLHEKMKEEFQQNNQSYRVKRKKRKSVKKDLTGKLQSESSDSNSASPSSSPRNSRRKLLRKVVKKV